MKKTEKSSSVDNKIFISDDDLRLFFEDKYTFGYEDEQTKTFDDEIHYNYDELVKFYGFKMHFANNGKGGRFDGWNYVIGTHPYIDYNLEIGNLHKSTNKLAKGGSIKNGYAIMQGDKLRTDAFSRVEFFETIEKALFKMSHVPRFKSLTKEEKIKLIIPYTNQFKKGGMVEYHDYKGVEIMYEPTYEEYFVNDEVFNSMESAKRHIDYMEKSNGVIIDYYNGYDINIYPKLNEYWVNDEIKFNSMEDAKNYIDTGEANETPTYIQNLYRRGAMAKGGSVNTDFKDYIVYSYATKNDVIKDNYEIEIEEVDLEITEQEIIRLYQQRRERGYIFAFKIYDKATRNKIYESQSYQKTLDEYEDELYSKGGSVKNGYMVFNYTDNLYATNEVFQTKNDAKRFIDEFKKRFVLQGYYRDSNMNKIDINDVDLYVLDADFNPYKFSEGGIVTYANLDLNTNRNIIAKAIEFISGTGVDAESMTLEGKEIRFKYRTSNTYTTISQKLISDTISTNRKSLELRGKNFATGGGVEKITQAEWLNQNFKEAVNHIIEIHKRVKLKSGNELLLLKKESGWGIAKYNPKTKKELEWYRYADKEIANYWIDKVDVDKYSDGGSIENKNKLWYEVLQKFFKIFYGEYEDDTAEKHIKDSQVTTDQAKYYYENFMDKYKTERTLSDGFKIFKQSLTKEELDSIQISFNSEDYADAEEHDTQKRYSTITIKKKENFKKGGIIKINDNITIKDNKVMANSSDGLYNAGTINEWFEDTKKEVQSILNDKDENGEILYKRIAESDNFIYYTLDFEDFNNAKYKISDVLDYYAVHKASGRGGDWEIWNGLSFMPLQDEFKYGKLNYQHPSLKKLMQQDSYYKSRKNFATGGDIENEQVYIDYMNKEKGFKRDRIYFNSYAEAVEWGRKNFERFNTDMINYV